MPETLIQRRDKAANEIVRNLKAHACSVNCTQCYAETVEILDELLLSDAVRAYDAGRAAKPCHDQFGHNTEACPGLDSESHKRSMPAATPGQCPTCGSTRREEHGKQS